MRLMMGRRCGLRIWSRRSASSGRNIPMHISPTIGHMKLHDITVRINSAFPGGFEPPAFRLGERFSFFPACSPMLRKALYFLTFFLFRVHSGSFHPACVLRRSRDQISRKLAESRKSVTVFFEYPPGLEISRCIQHLPYSARIGSKNKTVRKQPYHVRCSNIHVNRSSASAVPAARERNTSSNSGCV